MKNKTVTTVKFINNENFDIQVITTRPGPPPVSLAVRCQRHGRSDKASYQIDMSIAPELDDLPSIAQIAETTYRLAKGLEGICVPAHVSNYFFEATAGVCSSGDVHICMYEKDSILIPFAVIGSEAAQRIAACVVSVINANQQP